MRRLVRELLCGRSTLHRRVAASAKQRWERQPETCPGSEVEQEELGLRLNQPHRKRSPAGRLQAQRSNRRPPPAGRDLIANEIAARYLTTEVESKYSGRDRLSILRGCHKACKDIAPSEVEGDCRTNPAGPPFLMTASRGEATDNSLGLQPRVARQEMEQSPGGTTLPSAGSTSVLTACLPILFRFRNLTILCGRLGGQRRA